MLFTSEESVPVRGVCSSHSLRGQEKVNRVGTGIQTLHPILVATQKYLAKKAMALERAI